MDIVIFFHRTPEWYFRNVFRIVLISRKQNQKTFVALKQEACVQDFELQGKKAPDICDIVAIK